MAGAPIVTSSQPYAGGAPQGYAGNAGIPQMVRFVLNRVFLHSSALELRGTEYAEPCRRALRRASAITGLRTTIPPLTCDSLILSHSRWLIPVALELSLS